jgi:hypothetical protein
MKTTKENDETIAIEFSRRWWCHISANVHLLCAGSMQDVNIHTVMQQIWLDEWVWPVARATGGWW